MATIQDVGMAFGGGEDAERRRYLRQLQITASGGRRPHAERASAASLAQMKITVETVGGET